MMVVNWSQLHQELLIRIIENHVISLEDFVMFSCVCHSWHDVAYACDISKMRHMWTRQMPWLMLTDGNDDDVYSDSDSVRGHLFDTEDCYYDHCYMDERATISDDNMGDKVEVESLKNKAQESHYFYQGESSMINGGKMMSNKLKVMDDDDCDHCIDSSINDGDDDEEGRGKTDSLSCIDFVLHYQRFVLNLQWNSEKYYRLNLPEAYGKVCWGSPYGWIVTLGLDRKMELFNPLTKARLPLPSQDTCRCPWKKARGRTIRAYSIAKAVLLKTRPTYITTKTSSSPDHGSLMVVLFQYEYFLVSIAKPGDSSWRPIYLDRKTPIVSVKDVLYNNDRDLLQFVDVYGYLHYCNVHDTKQPFILKNYMLEPPLSPFLGKSDDTPLHYICQCGRDILWIIRERIRFLIRPRLTRTRRFRVYKVDPFTKVWEELQDLNGHSIFVGNNTTFSVSAYDAGSRRNCIYFTDDDRVGYTHTKNKVGGYDSGVFDMTKRRFQKIPSDGNCSKSGYCCPLWFSPAF